MLSVLDVALHALKPTNPVGLVLNNFHQEAVIVVCLRTHLWLHLECRNQ